MKYFKEQQVLDKVAPLEISILKDDLEYFKYKRDAIYDQIDFYIEQVNRNNEMCKEKK